MEQRHSGVTYETQSMSVMPLSLMPRFFLLAFLVSAVFMPAVAECAVKSAPPEPPLSVMAGEMIMVGFRGRAVDPNSSLAQALKDGKAGGVILFSRDHLTKGPRNIDSPAQLKALTANLRRFAPGPLLIAVDQEGGKVQRLSSRNGFRDWPSARALGQGSPSGAYTSARDMGRVLADAGINLNFAPSVDLDVPGSPAIGMLERAFSANPAKISAHAAAFVRGMKEAGVLCALKHFPGHGSATADTHNGAADVSSTWTTAELEPYRALIADGFQGMIMASHISLRQYGEWPASLSPAMIDGLLRKELGWNGVVITDDLQMKAITNGRSLREIVLRAVNAGADILLFGNNLEYDENLASHVHATLMALVDEGLIAPERIRTSWLRIRALKAELL